MVTVLRRFLLCSRSYEAMAHENLGIEDPFQKIIGNLGQQELQPHQDKLIKEAEKLLKNIK